MKIKPILLYTKHRQTIPILEDNKNDYYLISFDSIWRILRVFGKTNSSKFRARIYYWILCLLRPQIILDINWIGRVALIHYLYSKRHKVKLVAVQHGFYTGGYISTRFPEGRWHKMARCTHFWIWSDVIRDEVISNGAELILKGNPLYNKFITDRKDYRHITQIRSILILPTSFERQDAEKLEKFNALVLTLKHLGYELYVKFHPMNFLFPDLTGIKVMADLDVYKALADQEFDLIIADHSTTLLDAIYFNNLVSFCNFHNSPNTLYEKFLGELNIESIEVDLLNIISSDRIQEQMNLIAYLGLNNRYNNSLLRFIN